LIWTSKTVNNGKQLAICQIKIKAVSTAKGMVRNMKKKKVFIRIVLTIILLSLSSITWARTPLTSQGFTPIYIDILGEEKVHDYMDETTQYIHPREGYSDEYMAINLEKAFAVYAEAWQMNWKLPSAGQTTTELQQLVPQKVQQLKAGEQYLLRFYIGALFNPNIPIDQFAKAKTFITTRSQNKNQADDSDEIVIEKGLLALVVPQENIWVDYENIRLKMDETIGPWWGPLGKNSSSPFKGTTNTLKENPESIYKWDINKRPFETLNALEGLYFRDPSELDAHSQFMQSLIKNIFKETIGLPFGYAGTAIGIMGSAIQDALPEQTPMAQLYQTLGQYNLNAYNIFEIIFPPQTTFKLKNAIVEIPIEVKGIDTGDKLAFYLYLNDGTVAFTHEWDVSKPLYESKAEESPDEGHEGGAISPHAGEMVLVKGGTFQMGNTRGDREGDDDETVHTVKLTYDYYLGKYEVTFNEYDAYCEYTGKSKPSDYSSWAGYDMGRGNKPVINVSWWDAIAYCNWLSESEGLSKAYDSNGYLLDKNGNKTTDITQVEGYRLPTEAEWEYAARGGHKSTGEYKYAGSNSFDTVAWHTHNSSRKTHEVGQKAPNELGLYDMSGNVWECCTTGMEVIPAAPKPTPQAQTAPPTVSYAAGVGTTMPRAAGSPTATTTAPAAATTTSASASPGPENDSQFSVTLFFVFFLFHFPNEGKTGSVFKTVIATIREAICEADGQIFQPIYCVTGDGSFFDIMV